MSPVKDFKLVVLLFGHAYLSAVSQLRSTEEYYRDVALTMLINMKGWEFYD